MPLVRADGLPTQHMRALAYWSAAPELDDVISLQVCGTEWVAHVTCRRQLIDDLGAVNGNGHGSAKGGGPPTHDVFHGMVAREQQAITSSKEGALLIDDLVEWIEDEIEADPERAAVRRAHPDAGADRRPGRARLLPPAADVQAGRLRAREAAGRGEAQPRLGPGPGAGAAAAAARSLAGERPGDDPDYRFAVVQSQMYRRHLRQRGRRLRRRCRWPATSRTSPAGTARTSARRRSSGSRRRSSTRASAGSDWRRPDAHPAGRQPRLLHLQRLPPAGRGLRARSRSWSTTTPSPGACSRARTSTRSCSRPGPGRPATLARLRRLPGHPPLQRDPGARHLPRPPGDRQPARGRRRRSAPMPMHGRLSRVRHDGTGLFEGVPQDFSVVRYHSLAITGPMGPEGHETAWSDDGVVMGIEHRTRPMWGVQFHPESIATEHGRAIAENFYAMAERRRPGAAPPHPRAAPSTRWRRADRLQARRPERPGRSAESAESGRGAAAGRGRWRGRRRRSTSTNGSSPSAEHSFWLDSADAPTWLAQCSFMGTSAGPRALRARLRRRRRRDRRSTAAGQESVQHGSIFDLLDRELRRLAVEPPAAVGRGLIGGYVGYLGYELKADCGSPNVHSSDLPDAALMLANRVVAVDHADRPHPRLRPRRRRGRRRPRRWLEAADRRWSRAAIAEPPPSSGRWRRRAEPGGHVSFRVRPRPRAVPRRHRPLAGRTGRRRVLRGLPHRPDLDRRQPRPVRALPPAAAQQPGAVRRLPALRRARDRQLLARALPLGRPRARRCRRGRSRGRSRAARTRPRTPPAAPSWPTTKRPAPST